MKSLLQQIKTRAEACTATLLFTRRDIVGQVPIDYYLNVDPSRPDTDTAPFCMIFPGKGKVSDRRSRQVRVMFCLHNQDREAALDDLDRLAAALVNLSHPGGWCPWVRSGFADFFGHPDTSMQPHPLYYYTILMDFESIDKLIYTPWRG